MVCKHVGLLGLMDDMRVNLQSPRDPALLGVLRFWHLKFGWPMSVALTWTLVMDQTKNRFLRDAATRGKDPCRLGGRGQLGQPCKKRSETTERRKT